MKKLLGIIIATAVICALAYWYLSLGKKTVVESKAVMENAQSTIGDAKKSVENLNKSMEESRKAIKEMGGGR
jgi:hypothetical protein